MALAGEAGEVVAELQWLSDADVTEALSSTDLRDRLADEVADVFLYLLLLAEASGVDLMEAASAKITINESRFPVESEID